MVLKKNLKLLKTKGAAPQGHLSLPLLFLENKSCMHDELGTCKEIFSLIYVLKPRTTGIKATAPSPLKQWNKVHCNFYYHQTDIPTYSFVQFQGLLPQVPKIVRDKCEPNTTYTLLYCTLYFAGFQYNIHFHPKSNRAAHGVEVSVSPLPYFIIILL